MKLIMENWRNYSSSSNIAEKQTITPNLDPKSLKALQDFANAIAAVAAAAMTSGGTTDKKTLAEGDIDGIFEAASGPLAAKAKGAVSKIKSLMSKAKGKVKASNAPGVFKKVSQELAARAQGKEAGTAELSILHTIAHGDVTKMPIIGTLLQKGGPKLQAVIKALLGTTCDQGPTAGTITFTCIVNALSPGQQFSENQED